MTSESTRDKPSNVIRLRCGLGMKSALVLLYVVVGVVCAGGWHYYQAVSRLMVNRDLEDARRLGKALSLSAEGYLALPFDAKVRSLDNLTEDLVRFEKNLIYAAVVGPDGKLLSSARTGDRDFNPMWDELSAEAVVTQCRNNNLIFLARPISGRDPVLWEHRLAGAIRLVVDSSQTQQALAEARRNIIISATLIALIGVPGGYVLVWQFTVHPIRELVTITRRFARGEFDVRSRVIRRDETGELASAFNEMADEVVHMRDELLLANQQLEQKVADRTAALERANTRLREEMTDKEQFLRAVSHDLNAPLRNIAGMATMIMMKYRDSLPEEVVARLGRIQSNVDTQGALIGDLLELSRIRSRSERYGWVDLNELLGSLREALEYEIQKRHITLEVTSALPTLYAERNRIYQVFQNVVDNAVKYMHREQGGRISISSRLLDDKHLFVVADNGPGIAPEEVEQIFCVFRRAGAARQVEGKGVGLAVVRTIVSKYQGRAWVESTPGEGTRFYFTLADGPVPPECESSEVDNEQHCEAIV